MNWYDTSPDVKGLPLRMRQRRCALGITQAVAERRADMPARNWDHYEAGRRMPKADTLARIALALETTTDHLVGLSDEPSPRLRRVGAKRRG